MAAIEDKIQSLMNEFYTEWQKEENKDKGKWDVLGGFSAAHQIAVVLGNFNYQVGNGGIEQWIYNGYFHDDGKKLIEYLEIGEETDERCRTILDRIYKLDQYAQETDCDRYGNFYDDEGEGNFIGEMVNCDEFDTWYYSNCGEENWWQVVCGIIDKVEGRESALVRQDEHDGEITAAPHPLRLYIENAHDDSIGGFTMPLPTTMDALQPFLDGAEIRVWQDMRIMGVQSDIGDLGDMVYESIRKDMSPDMFDELNYLAAKIQALSPSNSAVFISALEAKRHCGSVAEIINLTDNLDKLIFQPAFSPGQYGEFLLGLEKDNTSEIMNRLENSNDPDDRAFVQYILRLEASANAVDYGRAVIKEEQGTFTKSGYLTESDGFKEIYLGPENIPPYHRVFDLLSKVETEEFSMVNNTKQADRDAVAEKPSVLRMITDARDNKQQTISKDDSVPARKKSDNLGALRV